MTLVCQERRTVMKLIHISDLHYHRNPGDNQEADSLLEIIRNRYPTHSLIVTGDISDDGHPTQFENAFKALEPFLGRVFIVPGNHDFGAAGNFYSCERACRFDEMLSIRLDQGGTFTGDNTPVVHVFREGNESVMLIALDTNLETENPFDFACGEVGKSQMATLDTILCNPANAVLPKILFFHHHPFMHGNPFMQLKDAEDLMRTIYMRVDVVLFGHKHVSEMWKNRNGVQYFLASDNSPGKDYVREISIAGGKIYVQDIGVAP